ncbi:natriuretic peptides A-like [Discoglossus pictus]
MELKSCLVCWSLLLVIIQCYSAAAYPVLEMDTEGDLSSFKGLLERLEEKLSLLGAQDASPDDPEPRVPLLESKDSESEVPQQQPEPRLIPNSPYPIKESYLKGLRALQNTKMMRGSGCFGRRMDRIDSLSGMGCNGNRWH